MDLSRVVSQLREELEHLNAAILSLERLQQEGRRRGRPPKVLSEVSKASRAVRKSAGEKDAEEG